MKSKPLQTDQRIIRVSVAGILFMILIFSFLFDPSKYQLIECAFHNITGLPCPSCGLTRSFHSMAHLHFNDAFGLNWMGPVLFTGILLLGFMLFGEAVSGSRIQFRSKVISLKVLFFGLIGLWLVVWVVRLVVGDGQ